MVKKAAKRIKKADKIIRKHDKAEKVMHEFKEDKLHSAIALSEARHVGKKRHKNSCLIHSF